MSLYIETDIGHDPDDVIALRYLMLKGVDIKGIIIMPGYAYQYAMARKVCPGVPLYGSERRDNKESHCFSKLYKRMIADNKNGCYDIHTKDLKDNTGADLLVIGPPKNAEFYTKGVSINRTVFQGGFIPYSVHRPKITLDKFESLEYNQSFNPGGCREGVELIKAATSQIEWVPKNVCHTVCLKNTKFHDEFLNDYIKGFSPDKKIHDAVAAILYINSKLGTWKIGFMEQHNGGWTFQPMYGYCCGFQFMNGGLSYGLVDLDYEAFYEELGTV